MPFIILWHLHRSAVWSNKFDGAGIRRSIFLGPVAHVLKWKSTCKLIEAQNTFPDWALDLDYLFR